MSIAENVARIRAEMREAAIACGRDPSEILLCAATKMNDADAVRQAIAAGVDCCGENRVQELTAKLAENAYEGAPVHFIGHLQTNKVKQVVGRVDLIESVDSDRLLDAINKRACELELVQDILLEVNIAGEESKGGVEPALLPFLVEKALELPHIRLRGLMCIPPVVVSGQSNRKFFAQTRQLFVDITGKIADNNPDMDCLSMGMSSDYEDAVEEGATLVRVGTALFGPRPTVPGK